MLQQIPRDEVPPHPTLVLCGCLFFCPPKLSSLYNQAKLFCLFIISLIIWSLRDHQISADTQDRSENTTQAVMNRNNSSMHCVHQWIVLFVPFLKKILTVSLLLGNGRVTYMRTQWSEGDRCYDRMRSLHLRHGMTCKCLSKWCTVCVSRQSNMLVLASRCAVLQWC